MNSRKPKRPKAAWTRAFPKQAQALSPEKSGNGIRSLGSSQRARLDVYGPIATMFKSQHFQCEACPSVTHSTGAFAHITSDVHHKKGKEGLLLFDIRYWLPVCRECHTWIHNNPAKAIELGLTLSRG